MGLHAELHGTPRNAHKGRSDSGRPCRACGRPLTEEHHDLDGFRLIPDRKHGFRRAKRWGCRVRLVAHQTAPILQDARQGRPLLSKRRKTVTTYVPDTPQRTRENLTAFIPLAVLDAQQRG